MLVLNTKSHSLPRQSEPKLQKPSRPLKMLSRLKSTESPLTSKPNLRSPSLISEKDSILMFLCKLITSILNFLSKSLNSKNGKSSKLPSIKNKPMNTSEPKRSPLTLELLSQSKIITKRPEESSLKLTSESKLKPMPLLEDSNTSTPSKLRLLLIESEPSRIQSSEVGNKDQDTAEEPMDHTSTPRISKRVQETLMPSDVPLNVNSNLNVLLSSSVPMMDVTCGSTRILDSLLMTTSKHAST